MKKSSIFYILACMTSLFIFSSCEENADQVVKAQPDTAQEITNRSIDDCEDCPIDYCCCGIELLSATTVTLTMCGAYDGVPSLLCSPVYTLPMACSGANVSTYNSHIELDPISMPRALFCVPEGFTFRIYNPSNGSVQIRFTCQINSGNPDYETITIGGFGEVFFTTDGDCFLEQCV